MKYEDHIDELQKHPAFIEERFCGDRDYGQQMFDTAEYRWKSEDSIIVYFGVCDLAMLYEESKGWRQVLIGDDDKVDYSADKWSRNKSLASSPKYTYLFHVEDLLFPELGAVPIYGYKLPS